MRTRRRPSRYTALTRFIVVLLAAATVSGCAVIRQEFDTPVPEVRWFSDGRTNYREVLQALGPPAKLSSMEDGLVFLYEQVSITERQAGIDIDYQGVPILKFVVGRGAVDGVSAVFVFDDDGILRSHDWENWSYSLGFGTGLQLFISVISVTDPGGYDRPPAIHDWGAELLKPRLSETLNRRSNLDTGHSGVQRKGSPDGAGQHTLELQSSF